MMRFERQVDEANPGLRERNPRDFIKRVEALNKAHMAKMTMKSVKARAAKKAEREHGLPPTAGDYSI